MAFSNVSTKTVDDFKGFTCYWRIKNFFWNCDNYKSMISSPVFRIHTLQSKWHINIHGYEDGLGAFLQQATRNTCTTLDMSISLLTDSGWETVQTKCRREFNENYSWGSKMFSWADLINKHKLYILNNSLTITFNVCNYQLDDENTLCLLVSRMHKNYTLQDNTMETFSTLRTKDFNPFPPQFEFQINQVKSLDDKKEKEVKDQPTQTAARDDFKNTTQGVSNFVLKDLSDLLKLFTEKKFSFITLRTSDRDFTVHKAVLCAKSHVFDAMFEQQMKENNSNLVHIDDIDSHTMAMFVSFLHFEPLGDLNWEHALKLYYAADKYQIDVLKNECVSLLKNGLSVENICDVFCLADLHQDKDLMDCAMDYFCKNSKAIFPSKKWKDLLLSHPELISEILCKLAEKM